MRLPLEPSGGMASAGAAVDDYASGLDLARADRGRAGGSCGRPQPCKEQPTEHGERRESRAGCMQLLLRGVVPDLWVTGTTLV